MCAKFRQNYRLPALSYFHKETEGSIWRSSQNMSGILFSRSEQDELFLTEIKKIPAESSLKLPIFDCRRESRALFNLVKHGGIEDKYNYSN